MYRDTYQGVVDDSDDDEEDLDPKPAYEYTVRSLKLMRNPAGYAYFPELLMTDPSMSVKDKRSESRTRPLLKNDVARQKKLALYDQENQ